MLFRWKIVFKDKNTPSVLVRGDFTSQERGYVIVYRQTTREERQADRTIPMNQTLFIVSEEALLYALIVSMKVNGVDQPINDIVELDANAAETLGFIPADHFEEDEETIEDDYEEEETEF